MNQKESNRKQNLLSHLRGQKIDRVVKDTTKRSIGGREVFYHKSMKFGLTQRLAVIGVSIFVGCFGVLTRNDLLKSVSPNPNDFGALFWLIFLTAAWIDFLVSLPAFGLLIAAAASRSFGAGIGVIVLDHKAQSIIFPLFLIIVFEVTALLMAGLASFRLVDLLDSRRSARFPMSGKDHVSAYFKLLGLALLITFLSALFESASILHMLPFGL